MCSYHQTHFARGPFRCSGHGAFQNSSCKVLSMGSWSDSIAGPSLCSIVECVCACVNSKNQIGTKYW